jgi:hypothetical protein
MLFDHVIGIISNPDNEWQRIRSEKNSLAHHYFQHAFVLALIPAVSLYFGASQVGWTLGSNPQIYKLTASSAMEISVMFYIAMISGVFVLGKFIDFMHITYWGEDHKTHGVAVASYVSTPMFLIGIVALYPVLWLDIFLAMAAICYSVYLLFEGIPIVMGIEKEKGFLFATSIITIGLVMLVSMIAMTVIIWSVGFGPEFIRV